MAGSFDAGLIPFYTTEFSTRLELLLQQKMSMLRGKVDEGFHVGKMASPINQIGAVSMRAPAGRFAPKAETNAVLSRRWVFPVERELDQLIDSFDEFQTIVDPKTGYVAAAAAAVAREWDDSLITAATGTSQLGQDAGSLTSETFDTANFQVAVDFDGTDNGISYTKILEGRRILQHYHNNLDADPATLVIGSNQESDLLKLVQMTSTEFVAQPVIEDGRIRRILNCDLVISERLPYNVGGSNQRGALMFVRSGMYLGIWKDISNRISIRNERSSEPTGIYTSAMFGSTRTQPGKVIQILCVDTTGADITP